MRWCALLCFVAASVAAGLCVGPAALSSGDAWAALWGEGSPLAERLVHEVRLPRVVVGLLVGAALSVAGALFQSLLRNGLAEPFLLGVGPGALLGVTCAAWIAGLMGAAALPGAGVRGAAAFVGALGVGAFIFGVARRTARAPTAAVLLTGIAVGAFVHAVATLLLHVAIRDWHVVVRWMLGDLGLATWGEVGLLAALVLVGCIVAWVLARDLDVLTLGEESAWFGGVAVHRVLLVAGGAACLLAASTVAVAGLVGFVGLVVPHLARAWVGSAHQRLLPAAALIGAGLLVAADLVARTAFAPQVIPLGVVTALLGAPFLAFWVLRRGSSA